MIESMHYNFQSILSHLFLRINFRNWKRNEMSQTWGKSVITFLMTYLSNLSLLNWWYIWLTSGSVKLEFILQNGRTYDSFTSLNPLRNLGTRAINFNRYFLLAPQLTNLWRQCFCFALLLFVEVRFEWAFPEVVPLWQVWSKPRPLLRTNASENFPLASLCFLNLDSLRKGLFLYTAAQSPGRRLGTKECALQMSAE